MTADRALELAQEALHELRRRSMHPDYTKDAEEAVDILQRLRDLLGQRP